MIPLFVGYAVIAWVLTCKHRRTLLGLAIVMASVLVLVGIAVLHHRIGAANPNMYMQGMQVLLYPYIVLVAGIGGFLFALPHRPTEHCVSCGYDLEGLRRPIHVCPECGRANPELVGHRRSGAEREQLRRSDAPRVVAHSADHEPNRQPNGQDQPRHTRDERPAQHAELALVERADQADGSGSG